MALRSDAVQDPTKLEQLNRNVETWSSHVRMLERQLEDARAELHHAIGRRSSFIARNNKESKITTHVKVCQSCGASK